MTSRVTQNQPVPTIENFKRFRQLSVGATEFNNQMHGEDTRMGSGPDCWKLDYSNNQQGSQFNKTGSTVVNN